MKITKEQVAYVAHLARLELDEAAVATFAEQIGSILDYMDMLNGVDTQGVQPTSHATSICNAFRDDAVREHLDTEAATANAPEKDDGSFIVPKVVG